MAEASILTDQSFRLQQRGRIPVLDIGPFLAGERGAASRRRLRARSPAPARTPGFLSSPATASRRQLVENAFAEAARFFCASMRRPSCRYQIGRYNIGYLPFGGQVVRHSPVNQQHHTAQFQRELLRHP